MNGNPLMVEEQKGAWKWFADWRWRWLTMLAGLATGVILAAVWVGGIKNKTETVIADVAILQTTSEQQMVGQAKLEGRVLSVEHRVDAVVQFSPVDAVGRLDERVKSVEKTLVKIDEKLDRVLEHRSR